MLTCWCLQEENRINIAKLWRAVQEASEEYLGAKNQVTAAEEKKVRSFAAEADKCI